MRALALVLAGCPGPPAPAVCDEVCELLMADCDYAAFPDVASCQQGCQYGLAHDTEVRALHSCLVEARCDTPTVLACARSYGGTP